MSELFGRKIELKAGSKSFTNDDFTIYFDVPFDDGEDVNVAEIEVYNLTDQTINEIKQASKIVLNAGYEGDVGAILLGNFKGLQTDWDSVDKISVLDVVDASEDWMDAEIKKTYKDGITAKQILNDILSKTGLEIGAFTLPKNKVYPGGKAISNKLSHAIKSIARDCGAKIHINRGKIFIRPKDEGDEIGFVLDSRHGLIASPTPIEKEVNEEKVSGWKVKSLLNHKITTDTLIEVNSKTANGVFRVESGKHFNDGGNFYTEMEVYPQ